MKFVECGMFQLPGIVFDKSEMNDDLRDEMVAWSEQSNCGMLMNDRLWSFMSESQRDWFLLRFSEILPGTE